MLNVGALVPARSRAGRFPFEGGHGGLGFRRRRRSDLGGSCFRSVGVQGFGVENGFGSFGLYGWGQQRRGRSRDVFFSLQDVPVVGQIEKKYGLLCTPSRCCSKPLDPCKLLWRPPRLSSLTGIMDSLWTKQRASEP